VSAQPHQPRHLLPPEVKSCDSAVEVLQRAGCFRPSSQPHSYNQPKLNGHDSRKNKSLESWLWDAVCFLWGAKDAPKFKEYILPIVFTKHLCDVFDDEINRIAKIGSRAKAFELVKADKKLVRFYLPLMENN
jgi:hypothetical protein